jgi:hypothetical protein
LQNIKVRLPVVALFFFFSRYWQLYRRSSICLFLVANRYSCSIGSGTVSV